MATQTGIAGPHAAAHGAAEEHAHADAHQGAHEHGGGACLNCGAALVGPFCHECGQKERHAHEHSLRHFFGHTVLHEFTHLDQNKILRTTAALLFRPGVLTAEYLSGRKGAQINPVRVYLTVSAVYFLFAWGALLNAGGFRDIERHPNLVAYAQRKGTTPAAVADKIMQKAEKYSSVLRFLGVLVSGLFLMGLYYRTGRFYVEHLIFSLHFYSFDFLLRCFYALGLTAGARLLNVNPYQYLAVRAAFYVVIFVYLYFALLRVYRQTRGLTFVKTVALTALEVGLFFALVAGSFLVAFRTAL
ncbi:MAG TPA: DUF3667 domain-containing protein [Pyrinomonadaceae bacterium]|nr:DUF3667 domain-containing protein [Pyrinomonadaceae bacterium]